MSKTLKWIFSISLILNVLFIGVEIGRFTHQFPPMGLLDPMRSEHLEKLSPESRQRYEAMMNSMDADRQKFFPQMEKTRKEIIAILEAPEFDEVAYKEKFKELDALFNSGKEKMVDGTATLAKQFTQKERSVLAERLKQMPPPPPPRRK